MAAVALFVSDSVSIARADIFVLNYEAPGVENTTAKFSVEGVETFDELAVGMNPGFTTDFGTDGAITGTYSAVQINSADPFGGAGGVGNYPVAYIGSPYTVTLTADPAKDPQGINYFGYWLSALDPGNIVTFYNNGVQVGQLNPSEVLAQTNLNPAYYGNPNGSWLHGKDSGEPFVFINFYDTTGTFDQITFTEGNNYGGGYESDNHTVGYYTSMGGAVPEPVTWAMILMGFAGLGFASLRKTRAPRSALVSD